MEVFVSNPSHLTGEADLACVDWQMEICLSPIPQSDRRGGFGTVGSLKLVLSDEVIRLQDGDIRKNRCLVALPRSW